MGFDLYHSWCDYRSAYNYHQKGPETFPMRMIEVVELSSNIMTVNMLRAFNMGPIVLRAFNVGPIVLWAFNVGPIADVSVSSPLCSWLRPGREISEFYIHIECYSMSP